MKIKFAILVLSLSITLAVWGQKPQANTYHTNNYINKFAGTWQWVSGNDTVILKLAKVRYYYSSPPGYSADELMGTHTYIKNGVLIESSMNKFDSIVLGYHKLRTISCLYVDYMDTSDVEGFLRDISKHKQGDLFLEYVGGATPQLIWKLENTKGLVATPESQPFDYSFTLPKDLILTKQ